MSEVLRLMVFGDRPDCLLVTAPDGPLVLPTLLVPFTKYDVAKTLGDAHIKARVSDGTPGRWTASLNQLRKADRAERGQQQRQREATEAVLLRGSNVADMRTRSEAIAAKHDVDDRIRLLKAQVAEAKTKAATRGEFMNPTQFRGLESRLSDLKDESQALQTLLGRIRDKERADNVVLHNQENDAFRKAAHKILPPETLAAIESAALDLIDGADDEPRAVGPT